MDHKIQKGTLRCGVTYYMVTNPQTRGYADFAVVRRSEAPAPGLREGLETGFLARRGIGPRPEGYYLEKEGSTLIHFDHVPVYDPAVLDSTLLVTFSQVAASRADEAVIVSAKNPYSDLLDTLLFGGNGCFADVYASISGHKCRFFR